MDHIELVITVYAIHYLVLETGRTVGGMLSWVQDQTQDLIHLERVILQSHRLQHRILKVQVCLR